MPDVKAAQPVVRFEGFELDLRSGELRRDEGKTVRLSEQPFRILVLLLERPQQVVTREELRKKLWPNDTIVEFEHSISAAMNRLRQALGDSAEKPRYIETLARRGYRWMVPVQPEPPLPDPSGATASVPAVRQESLVGKKVSHYRVLELVGGGGMGVVYKAEDIKLGRRVALKFLPEELTKDPVALGRFEREARSASSLDHPNICAVHEFDEHDGQPFIVMPLLEGQTLRERIAAATGEGTAIPIDELIRVAIRISEGLEAAHRKGIIHRDIKPANIFITTGGEAKILDFGLAKLHGMTQDVNTATVQDVKDGLMDMPTSSAAALALSKTGQTMGTASYMSPEQVQCEELDGRTDLFSLGLVLYEMATSQQAFAGNTAAVVRAAILHHTPTSARVLNPLVPRRLDEIITRCIHKDRNLRYQSASELGSDLKQVHGDLPTAIRGTTEPLTHSKKVGALAVAFGVLIVAGLVTWATFPTRMPKVKDTIRITNDGLSKGKLVTDGARLYFEVARGGSAALAQVSANGGETAQINNPFQHPAIYDISPNHSELLVSSGPVVDLIADVQLWVLPIPAGLPHRVGDILAHDACWAPDGEHLVYANGHDLYDAAVDGSNIQKLRTVTGIPSWIRFSPDGRRLRFSVFERPLQAISSIWEMASDGKDLHRVIENGWNGSWSPDGKYYYYQLWGDIWFLPETQSLLHKHALPMQLTTGPMLFGPPTPSLDGKRLYVAGGPDSRFELVRLDSTAKQFVPYLGGISAGEVDFSRDRHWVTYTTYPESALWRSKIDGSERLQLTFPPINAHEPRWSPDGKEIMFTDLPKKIFVVPANGGVPRQLMPEDKPDVAGSGNWSPDGNSIVFGRWVGAGKAIYLLNLTTHQFTKLSGSDGMYSARLSPDGRYVAAFPTSSDKLMLFDFHTQSWSELARGNFTANNWSHDSRYVYMENIVENLLTDVVRVSVTSRKLEHVASLKGMRLGSSLYAWWLSVGIDGLPILMRDVSSQEIYTLNLQTP